MHGKLKSVRGKKVGHVWTINSSFVMMYIAPYLIIILVHAGIVSLKDEFFLEVHVTFILDVFREPLFWAVGKNRYIIIAS